MCLSVVLSGRDRHQILTLVLVQYRHVDLNLVFGQRAATRAGTSNIVTGTLLPPAWVAVKALSCNGLRILGGMPHRTEQADSVERGPG